MYPVTQDDIPLESLYRIVSGVTFFKELMKTDPEQFELLISMTRFISANENEVILHKGDAANVLYFLMRGNLEVMADDDSEEVISEVNPGEPFGVMAMVLKSKRSASVRVSSKQALLAGVEFSSFRHDGEQSAFSLNTRIVFYRMLNSNIRWALERKKMAEPQHPLVGRMRTLPIYTGEKNTAAELHELMHLAHLQAELLRDWNEYQS